MAKKIWTQEQLATVKTMYAKGKTREEIGKVVGKTAGSVNNAIYHHGFHHPPIEISRNTHQWHKKLDDGRQVCWSCLRGANSNPSESCKEPRHIRHRENQRRWCRDYMRRTKKTLYYHLRHEYGMTLTQLEQMLKAQDGKCAICHRGIMDYQEVGIDHDHRTKVVRSLLCSKCNLLIGQAQENIGVLRAAIEYLEKWQKVGYIKPMGNTK